MDYYHGSGTDISLFDESFLGIGVEQEGSGFYFTESLSEAEGYAFHRLEADLEKPGGEDNPSVMVVDIAIDDDALIRGGETITADTIRHIILQGIERTKEPDVFLDCLANFGDVNYEGLDSVIENAVDAYSHYEDILPTLFALSNDLFTGEEGIFLRITSELTGYEGVYAEHEGDSPNHLIVWLPEAITIKAVLAVAPDDNVTQSVVNRPHL